MANKQSTGISVDEARYQVKKEEIVVHSAELVCNYGGSNGKKSYLIISDNHGILENGNNCAHDENCIPVENIQDFGRCTSPNLGKVLPSLIKEATGEKKEQYQDALFRYRTGLVPCVLPLLDRWFDADEKNIVTDTMKFREEIRADLESLKRSLLSNYLINLENRIIYISTYSAPKDEATKKAKDVLKRVKIIKSEIEKLCKNSKSIVSKDIEAGMNGFLDFINPVTEIRANVKRIEEYLLEIKELYFDSKNINGYENAIKWVNNTLDKLDNLINKIKSWEEKEYHLITTKSFLVCRGGGIITVANSGQDFHFFVERFTQCILTTIAELKEDCLNGKASCNLKETKYLTEKWKSYDMAYKGLEAFEYLILGSKSIEMSDVSVYLELISHSYEEEIDKTMLSFLGLISMDVETISLLTTFYDLFTIDPDEDNIADITSTFIGAIGEVEKEKLNSAGQLVVKANDVYSILSSLLGFLYISYETWIEKIVITVFTDSHAHIIYRSLTKEGNLKDEPAIVVHEKNLYINQGYGRGLSWKEDPGVYMGKKVHKGDKGNQSYEVDRTDSIVARIHEQ